ncbi:MAG: hypothetical protein LBE80_03310, partial [Deltaproteobacteria bacterium]|nr:hypothetical protein [Deltaproteobacteria bacterium]
MAPEESSKISLEKNLKLDFGAPKKSPSKSKLRRIIKFFGFSLLFLLIVLVGAVLWLRTDSGLNFLAKKALSGLSEKGLTLSWTSLEGPIPEKLIIQGLVASDKLGRFA